MGLDAVADRAAGQGVTTVPVGACLAAPAGTVRGEPLDPPCPTGVDSHRADVPDRGQLRALGRICRLRRDVGLGGRRGAGHVAHHGVDQRDGRVPARVDHRTGGHLERHLDGSCDARLAGRRGHRGAGLQMRRTGGRHGDHPAVGAVDPRVTPVPRRETDRASPRPQAWQQRRRPRASMRRLTASPRPPTNLSAPCLHSPSIRSLSAAPSLAIRCVFDDDASRRELLAQRIGASPIMRRASHNALLQQ